jgi:hypothetical protein
MSGDYRMSVRALLSMITIAVLDGFSTLAEVPLTPEQAEQVRQS